MATSGSIASDIVSADGVSPGSLITVADHRGQALGIALYSSASPDCYSPQFRASPSRIFRRCYASELLRLFAIANPSSGDTDAYRVIFSEADFLPGLIVDRYNDVLSVQILTQAMDATANSRNHHF